jgi:hypothetical protein
MHRRPAGQSNNQHSTAAPSITAHEIAPLDLSNPKKVLPPFVDVVIKRDVYFRKTNKLEKELADGKREKTREKKQLTQRLIIELHRVSLKLLTLLIGMSFLLLGQHRAYYFIGSLMLLIAVQIGLLMQDLLELKR